MREFIAWPLLVSGKFACFDLLCFGARLYRMCVLLRLYIEAPLSIVAGKSCISLMGLCEDKMEALYARQAFSGIKNFKRYSEREMRPINRLAALASGTICIFPLTFQCTISVHQRLGVGPRQSPLRARSNEDFKRQAYRRVMASLFVM